MHSEPRGASFAEVQLRLAAGALLVVAAAAWWFLEAMDDAMVSMRGEGVAGRLMMLMMTPGAPGPYLAASAGMWLAMMIAMMVPAALPLMLVFRGLDRGPRGGGDPLLFVLGYLATWSAVALLGAGAQWWLHADGLLYGHRLATATPLAGALLIAAGLWQLSPMKAACLAHCRGPLGFLLRHARPGRLGAFVMGAHHGLYCLGCCWMLMVLMFAGGVMSVVTMAVIAALILAERLLPAGPWVAKGPGVVMIVLGGVLL